MNGLEAMKSDWEKSGFTVVIASGDTEERAAADIAEFKWSMDVGYGLSVHVRETIRIQVMY